MCGLYAEVQDAFKLLWETDLPVRVLGEEVQEVQVVRQRLDDV